MGVRRFVIDKNVSTSYDYLVGKLEMVFPSLKGAQYSVCWADADGDNVTITSDEELIIALTEMAGPLYKLTVSVKKSKPVSVEDEGVADAEIKVHYGVTCDGCENKPITGNRYKCVVCDDYDLCESCEVAGRHPGHNMIKITQPGYIFPQRLFKRMQVLQDRAKNKQEKQEKKEENKGARPRREGCRGPRGRGMFGPFMQGGMGRGGSWSGMGGGGAWSAAGPALEAMMRGWAGEGAGGGHHQAHDAAHQAAADAHKAAQEAHEQVHNAAQEAAAAASMTGNEDYLKNVGSFVAAALDPLGIDVKIDIETPEGRKSCHVSNQSSEESKDDEKKDEASGDNEEAKKEEEKQQEKTKEETVEKSATPSDDEDEWTVLTDKKEEKVKDGSLYPSLVDTTDTKSAPTTEETAAAVVPSAPVATHPDPRIQVALQALMNMGFSNEGGWLSSLLEAKNGDIGKVLDILQPVKK